MRFCKGWTGNPKCTNVMTHPRALRCDRCALQHKAQQNKGAVARYVDKRVKANVPRSTTNARLRELL